MIEETTPTLPADRPRILMGVGTPEDILDAVARGIDMFDCVLPTRNGRHDASPFTRYGPISMKNARHADDPRPLDRREPVSRRRGPLRALPAPPRQEPEVLGAILLSDVNLAYYQQLLAGCGVRRSKLADLDPVTAPKQRLAGRGATSRRGKMPHGARRRPAHRRTMN